MDANKLKPLAETIDELPETLRPFYAEGEDGKYRLQVDGLVGKEKLAEFRNTNTELMKQLTQVEEAVTAYRTLGDEPAKLAEELKDLRALRQRVDDRDLIDKKGFEEALNKRTAEMKASADNQIRTLTEALKKAEVERDTAVTRHQRSVIDRDLTDAALAAGVRPTAIPDLLFRAERAGWILTDKNKVVLRDDEGGTQYVIGADGASPLTPKEWINGHVRDTAPHFFDMPTGGGALGSNGAAGSKNPWLKESWNMTEQGKVFREKPALAKQLAAAAGVNLDI